MGLLYKNQKLCYCPFLNIFWEKISEHKAFLIKERGLTPLQKVEYIQRNCNIHDNVEERPYHTATVQVTNCSSIIKIAVILRFKGPQ